MKFNKVIVSAIIAFILCAQPLFSSSFEYEKEFIDSHNVKTNIDSIFEYTLSKIEESENPLFATYLYAQALSDFESHSQGSSNSYEHYAIYGALINFYKLKEKENPDKVDLLEAAKFASFLLSPGVFESAYNKKKCLKVFKQSRNVRKFSYLLGKYQQTEKEEYLTEIQERTKEYRRITNQFNILCQSFTPVVFVGKNAVFSSEAYIYALSKGILLYGVGCDSCCVHGNVFSEPIELFLHDQVHYDAIFGLSYRIDNNEKIYGSLTNIASQIYGFISNQEAIERDVSKKMILAAFFFFHESNLSFHKYFSKLDDTSFLESLTLHSSSTGSRQLFLIVKESMERAFKMYLNTIYFSPPTTPTEEWDVYKEHAFPEKIKKAFSSDVVRDLVKVYKNQKVSDLFPNSYEECAEQTIEEFIYGGNKDLDRRIYYNGPRAYQVSLKLSEWFSDMIQDKLEDFTIFSESQDE